MTSGLRTFPIVTGEPSQGPRRLVGFSKGSPFAAVSPPLILITRNQDASLSKIDPDNLAHSVLVSKSLPVREASQP